MKTLTIFALTLLLAIPASAQVKDFISFAQSSNEAAPDQASVFAFDRPVQLVDYKPLHLHLETVPGIKGQMYVREESAPIDRLDFTNALFAYWNPDLGPIDEIRGGWTHHSNGEDGELSRSYDVWDGSVKLANTVWQGSFGRIDGVCTARATWTLAVGDENADLPELVSFFGIEDLSGSAEGALYYYPPNDSLPSMLLAVSGSMDQFSGQFAYNFNASWQKFWTGVMFSTGIMDNIQDYNQQIRTASVFVGTDF